MKHLILLFLLVCSAQAQNPIPRTTPKPVFRATLPTVYFYKHLGVPAHDCPMTKKGQLEVTAIDKSHAVELLALGARQMHGNGVVNAKRWETPGICRITADIVVFSDPSKLWASEIFLR